MDYDIFKISESPAQTVYTQPTVLSVPPVRPQAAPISKGGFCTQCGKPMHPEARFCTNCGKPVNRSK
jgi:predicted amidophosphoribosyltransferase